MIPAAGLFLRAHYGIPRDALAGVAAGNFGELALRRSRRAKSRCAISFRGKRYDRGSGDVCREMTSFSGLPPIRLQIFPEQKNLPNAQASTRRESGPFMAIVA
jgi:hypothetical protein